MKACSLERVLYARAGRLIHFYLPSFSCRELFLQGQRCNCKSKWLNHIITAVSKHTSNFLFLFKSWEIWENWRVGFGFFFFLLSFVCLFVLLIADRVYALGSKVNNHQHCGWELDSSSAVTWRVPPRHNGAAPQRGRMSGSFYGSSAIEQDVEIGHAKISSSLFPYSKHSSPSLAFFLFRHPTPYPWDRRIKRESITNNRGTLSTILCQHHECCWVGVMSAEWGDKRLVVRHSPFFKDQEYDAKEKNETS